jgi:Raf kinase inhibitor-like YbhB/YbcL family protein
LWKDINPPFEIINIPQWTQSLALIAHDPDAPNGDWIHWIIWNFSAKFTQIEEWKTPWWATIGENSRWEASYRWPCPPSGTHRYIFKLYALDTNYGDLSSKMTLAWFEGIVQWHVLWTAQIMWTYSK